MNEGETYSRRFLRDPTCTSHPSVHAHAHILPLSRLFLSVFRDEAEMIAMILTRLSSFIYGTSSSVGLNSASQRTQVDHARKYCETLAHLTLSGRQHRHRRAKARVRRARTRALAAMARSATLAVLAASKRRFDSAGRTQSSTGRCSCSR